MLNVEELIEWLKLMPKDKPIHIRYPSVFGGMEKRWIYKIYIDDNGDIVIQ